MKTLKAFAFAFCFCFAGVTQAQYQTTSTLTDNGAQILKTYQNLYPPGPISPVFAGKFSTSTQQTDDFLTFDNGSNPNLHCFQNNNDGTFTEVVTATKLVPPLTAVRQSGGTIFIGHNYSGTSELTSFTMVGCVPTVGGATFSTGPIFSISDKSPNNGLMYLSLEGLINSYSPGSGQVHQEAAGTVAIIGPFNFSLNPMPAYLGEISQPTSGLAPITISWPGTINQVPIDGDSILGSFFDLNGNLITVTFTGTNLSLDRISVANSLPLGTNVGGSGLVAQPVAMATGNFANDTQNSDLAVAAGDLIYIFEYQGGSWALVQTLQASGTITGLASGPLSSPSSDDLIAQVGSNAEIFSTKTFTLSTSPTYALTASTSGPGTITESPSQATYPSGTVVTLTATPNSGATFSSWSGACQGSNPVCTLTMTADLSTTATFVNATPAVVIAPPSATVSAGSSATYAVQPQNFSSTPTLSASCSIPKGSCSVSSSGQLVVITTPTTTAEILPLGYQLPTLWMVVLVMVFLFIPFSRRPRARLAVAVVLPLVLLGCSGGGPAPTQKQTIVGTPSGAYTVTVTATQGSQTASAQATLQVN